MYKRIKIKILNTILSHEAIKIHKNSTIGCWAKIKTTICKRYRYLTISPNSSGDSKPVPLKSKMSKISFNFSSGSEPEC